MSTADPAVTSVFKLAPDVSSLLKEFPAAWEPRQPGQLPGHKVEHVIETEGQPLFDCARWLDQVKLESARTEFRKIEEAGIIQRSDSPSQQTKTREEHKIIWCISHEWPVIISW